MIFFTITAFINMILLIKLVGTEENATMLFERYKIHYHKEYQDPESEQKGFQNFVNNLAVVNRLNSEHPSRIIAYQLNEFADLNPDEINEHFAINMLPYDHMENGTHDIVQREQKHKSLEDIHLYDLNEVDDLYQEWIKKWGKANFTKKPASMVHYYRFVKTIAEINKKKFAGEDVTLGPDADIVQEPNEYFYG